MRSDESKPKRHTDCLKLEEFIKQHIEVGAYVDILNWYAFMATLGLTQSARQRLSDLRKEGLLFDFDKSKKAYLYRGWQNSGQMLFELSQ